MELYYIMQHSLINYFYSDSWGITNEPAVVPQNLKTFWVFSVLSQTPSFPEASVELCFVSETDSLRSEVVNGLVQSQTDNSNQVTHILPSTSLAKKQKAQYKYGNMKRLINDQWDSLRWRVKPI